MAEKHIKNVDDEMLKNLDFMLDFEIIEMATDMKLLQKDKKKEGK